MREPPNAGKAQIVFRCREADRKVINAAAQKLGISTNWLMRTVVLQAAQQILQTNNVDAQVIEVLEKMTVQSELPPGMKR
jgi:uncharacterized protein (DUF1778 family)